MAIDIEPFILNSATIIERARADSTAAIVIIYSANIYPKLVPLIKLHTQ